MIAANTPVREQLVTLCEGPGCLCGLVGLAEVRVCLCGMGWSVWLRGLVVLVGVSGCVCRLVALDKVQAGWIGSPRLITWLIGWTGSPGLSRVCVCGLVALGETRNVFAWF